MSKAIDRDVMINVERAYQPPLSTRLLSHHAENPSDDRCTTFAAAKAGDLLLQQSRQRHSWSFTRIGILRIQSRMKKNLPCGIVLLPISYRPYDFKSRRPTSNVIRVKALTILLYGNRNAAKQ